MNSKTTFSFVLFLLLVIVSIPTSVSWAIYTPDNSNPIVSDAQQPSVKAPYFKGRFIIKFKPTLNESAQILLSQKRPFSSALSDGSSSLDALNAQYHVMAAYRVFDNDNNSLVKTQAEASSLQEFRTNSIKAKFPERTLRIFPSSSATVDLSRVYVFTVPNTTDIKALCQAYQSDPHVEYVQPDYEMQVDMTPNDPYYASNGAWQQTYDDLWGVKKIKANLAWDKTQGEQIVVGVVDTGLDFSHEDIASNYWRNPDEIAGNGVDDDGNGFIDDNLGWDFHNKDRNPVDDHGHGTHVSGTIAAIGNNAKGIIGVAPRAKIMVVKAFNNQGSAFTLDLSKALIYATENGADVINNSWGCSAPCPNNPLIEDAVRRAASLGSVVVFAAGNKADNANAYSPQNMVTPKPIVVGASSELDKKVSFSNVGESLDVMAPGGGELNSTLIQANRNILSLKASVCDAAMCPADLVVGGKYLRQAGTSMATPHVSGVAALILSKNPTFTTEEVLNIVRATADDIGAPGFDIYTGFGRINANKALAMTSPCVAAINQPGREEIYTAPTLIAIGGTASCRNFLNYTLEIGSGIKPATWTTLSSGTTPVVNFLLGAYSLTSASTEGFYTLRLTVRNRLNQSFIDYRRFGYLKSLHPGWPIANTFSDTTFPASQSFFGITFNAERADSGSGASYFNIALWQNGMASRWPINLGQMFLPLTTGAGDFGGTGLMTLGEIDKVYAFNTDGSILDGWPKRASDYESFLSSSEGSIIPNNFSGSESKPTSSAVPADLIVDEDPLVIVDDAIVGFLNVFNADNLTNPFEDRIYIWDLEGNVLASKTLPALTPAEDRRFFRVANITGDASPEIIVFLSNPSVDQPQTRIFVYDKDLQILPGWPKTISENLRGYPILGDLTNDGRPEIIFLTLKLLGTPQFFHNKIFALKADGTSAPGWPVNADFLVPDGNQLLGGPTMGDLDNDGNPEVCVAINSFSVYKEGSLAVFGRDGVIRTGWPVQLEMDQVTAPLIVDVNGDGQNDLVGGGSGAVYAVDRNGKNLPEWPKPIKGSTFISPLAGQLDTDLNLELFAGGSEGGPWYLFDLPGRANLKARQWEMFGYDAKHSGLFKKFVNRPPDVSTLWHPNTARIQEGGPVNFRILAEDHDFDKVNLLVQLANGQPLSSINAKFTIDDLDGMFPLEQDHFATGILDWKPSFQQAGNYTFKATSSDGTQSASANITVTVLETPQPTVVPSSGTSRVGETLLFRTNLYNLNGWSRFKNVYFLINSTLSTANAGYILYEQNTGLLRIRNNGNTTWVGSCSPGATGQVIENSFVSVNCGQSTVVGSGNKLSLNLSLKFKAPFVSATEKKIYLKALDDVTLIETGGVVLEWFQVGTRLISN